MIGVSTYWTVTTCGSFSPVSFGLSLSSSSESSFTRRSLMASSAATLSPSEYRRSAPVTGQMFRESLDHAGRGPVRAAMKTVGLTWRGWHSFRRGLASKLFELGVSDKVVQRILRHSRVSITWDRYVKVRDPKVEAAMQTLERAVNRPANLGREESSSSA